MTGSDRERFEVLALGQPVVTPEDDADQFSNRVFLEGRTPGKFSVSIRPAAP